jgi:hypothetical protein
MTPARCAIAEWQLTVAQFGSMIAGAMYDHFAGRLSAPPQPARQTTSSAKPNIKKPKATPKLDRVAHAARGVAHAA